MVSFTSTTLFTFVLFISACVHAQADATGGTAKQTDAVKTATTTPAQVGAGSANVTGTSPTGGPTPQSTSSIPPEKLEKFKAFMAKVGSGAGKPKPTGAEPAPPAQRKRSEPSAPADGDKLHKFKAFMAKVGGGAGKHNSTGEEPPLPPHRKRADPPAQADGDRLEKVKAFMAKIKSSGGGAGGAGAIGKPKPPSKRATAVEKQSSEEDTTSSSPPASPPSEQPKQKSAAASGNSPFIARNALAIFLMSSIFL